MNNVCTQNESYSFYILLPCMAMGPLDIFNRLSSGAIGFGSIGSMEPISFQRWLREHINFPYSHLNLLFWHQADRQGPFTRDF